MNAGDVMTRDVVTVTPETPVAELVQVLLSHGISGVPVVDEERRVVGVVSEGDLLRRAEMGTEKRRGGWMTFFTGTEKLAGEYVRSHGRVATDVMTRDVVCVQADTPLADIADLMEDRHIKRVPVLKDEVLVGLVSRSNLLRAFASRAEVKPGGGTDDAAIRQALLTELELHTWSRRTENSMVVTDGVVHLWGMVSGPEENRALELVAERVPGVVAVRNHLVVMSEIPYLSMPGPMIT
ncbi:MAG TPA: CBS domain-containing protein [Acetobacteraceae bacterium]|jgi:CBS-domain-containing membrane protein|nr:CBS domain-containing protein [Acetobacteraceae bacterium]